MAPLMHQNYLTAAPADRFTTTLSVQFAQGHYCNCCVLPCVYIAMISKKLCS